MSISLSDTFVELRFQVSTASLEAACEAIAPYVLNIPDALSCHPGGKRNLLASPSGARCEGVTQKEIDMLLRGYAPSGR